MTCIESELTGSQLGAALRLVELGQVIVSSHLQQQLESIRGRITREFAEFSVAGVQVFQGLDNCDGLDVTLAVWMDRQGDVASEACIGYWLMCVFLRGLDENETRVLTKFLAGSFASNCSSNKRIVVRRYPTGGISEKQALILPAFLRYSCKKFGWSSSFLVARRLAHTGGTHDKLAILPGMEFATTGDLRSWDGENPPVRYFSAGIDFCPRDALLYRFRGETGTVPDRGLMVSSVMAKQVAMPADVIVLDVLYGATAFLKSERDAQTFVRWCQTAAASFNISIVPFFRQSEDLLGRCVGNVAETLEAVQLLENAVGMEGGIKSYELLLSLKFMEIFAMKVGANSQEVVLHCLEGLQSGGILRSLHQLWSEHGVASEFLEGLRRNSRSALLDGMSEVRVESLREGVVAGWDAFSIADIVNNRLNAYITSANGSIVRSLRGGVELMVQKGSLIGKGECLAIFYSEIPSDIGDVRKALQQAFQINRPDFS